MNTLCAERLVTGYRKARGDVRPVSRIDSLQIQAGALIALLGPNGSGKSTLMRTLAGLQWPLHGHVRASEFDLHRFTGSQRARVVTYTASEAAPSAQIRVDEFVALGRIPHMRGIRGMSDVDIETVVQALRDTNLENFIDRNVAEISDGERQRVTLARALAQQTRFLLLDEPTAHLDIRQRGALSLTLRTIVARDGTAIIVSTHDLDFALSIAERVWVLNESGALSVDTSASGIDRSMLAAAFGQSLQSQ